MAVVTRWKEHLGDWISVRAHAERTPPRFTLTLTLGELPAGWSRPQGRAHTWVGSLRLVCIAPFVLLLGATLLRAVGLGAPYAWRTRSSIAMLAATISLFIGIPVPLAVHPCRTGRRGS